MFASKHTFADQPRLTDRAFEIAKRIGARIVRVFSYWRTVDPDACFDRVVAALPRLAEKAAAHDLIIGLENEHACNIATGAETARVLAAIDHPNLKVVWDPANALVSGEKPFPEGYGAARRAHCSRARQGLLVKDHKPLSARSAKASSIGTARSRRWCATVTRAGSASRLTGTGRAATSTTPA